MSVKSSCMRVNFSLHHVRRTANAAADGLAKHAHSIVAIVSKQMAPLFLRVILASHVFVH